MNNSITSDDSVFILNTTDVNNTLLSPIPLSTIVTGTVCSFGILANFLVLLVISLTSLRTSVFMNLIMHLAIVDTMSLFSVVHGLRGIFGELIIKPSLLYCRFTIFCIYVTGIVSSWVTVLISFERYIAIFYPFRVHIYCTKTRMLVAVIIITILACASQIPLFFTCSLIFIGQRPKCQSFVRDTWIETMLIFFTYMIYSFVPLIVITVLNVLLLRKIRVINSFRARSQGQHSVSTSFMKNMSLMAMMICLCVVFAVTTLPGTILIIIDHLCKVTTGRGCIIVGGWLSRIVFMLNDINHGVNFFLYCLTGSVFRQAFLKLFKCK